MTGTATGTDAVDTGARGDSCHRLVVGPNASLTVTQAALFMLGMCTLSFGIAAILAWRGYWMVLPFAGLEMLALGVALWWSLRGNAYREVISIGSDWLRVESGRWQPERCWEFPRAWARLQLEPEMPAGRSRLWLTYAGARCEVGACLGEDERAALARRIRELLAPPSGDAFQNDRG